MKQHILCGHFGPSDRPGVPGTNNEIITTFNLVESKKRLGHGIGSALDDLVQLNIYPSEIGLDLLILAAHVHAADTRISRETESQDSWTREIHLVVPVSNPTQWATMASLLQRMLNFLTGDRWTIDFRSRPRTFTKIVPTQPRLRSNPPYDRLALFSGGLDSLIGAIDVLEAGGKPLLISHAGEGATSNAQEKCFDALKEHYKKSPFERLRVWMSFPEGFVDAVKSEKTTRGRSFLFFAIGVFAGSGFSGDFKLRAAENGLMALNIPLDPLRLGSLSTRTMHPFYIARWNELLGMLGIPGHIENPYRNKTKGEMIAECANRKVLRKLTTSSLSCSSPTKGRWKKRGVEHCGYCLPCLIRRAALQKGLGPGVHPTTYTLKSLTARALDPHEAEGQQVRSFQFAIQRLRTNPGLAKLLIHKSGRLADEQPATLKALAGVYRRGIEEVAVLLKRGKYALKLIEDIHVYGPR